MTRKDSNRTTSEIKAMMAKDGDFLRPMVRTVMEEIMEAEMSEAVGAQKGERMEGRLGYRSGYYPRASLIQPQDHEPPDRDRSPPLSKSGNSVGKLIPESHLPVPAGYQEKVKPGEPLLIDVSRCRIPKR
jgi:Transposase, Mutator family